MLVETNKQEFPCHFERQNFQAGLYIIGIEPSTNHVLGKSFARARAELSMLEHGHDRRYSTKFVVLHGYNEITAVQERIGSIAHA